MKSIIFCILILLTNVSLAQWTSFGPEQKPNIEAYEQEKLDYVGPMFLSIVPGSLIHGLGHMTSRKVKTGLTLMAIEMTSVIYVLQSESLNETKLQFCLLTFFGTWIYDMVATPFAIHEHNSKLKKKYNISLHPTYEDTNNKIGIGFTVNF